MSARALVLAALVLAILSAGCRGRTQVVVRVSADQQVLDDPRYHHVRVLVRSVMDPDGAEPRLDEEVRPLVPIPGQEPVPWPFDVVLTPERDDASRRYRVIVTAENEGDAAFVTSVAVSGYIPGETRVLHMHLSAVCRDVGCGTRDTCRRGFCESAEILPDALPRLGQPPPDVSAADAGAPEDASRDAPALDTFVDPDLDAWLDPNVDAGIDAAVTPDAGPLGPRFTAVSRTSTGSSGMVQHGASLCCSADGAFYAATEPLGVRVVLSPSSAGTLETPNVVAVACRPDAHAVLTAGVSTIDTLLLFTSPSSTPPWTESPITDTSATAEDRLGASVAMSSAWVIAGAPGRGGGAAIVADATSRMVVRTLLSSDTQQMGDRFGAAVAISGDGRTIAVGAPDEDGAMGEIDGTEDELVLGAGVVFVFTSASWMSGSVTETRIKAPTPSTSAFFGLSVALDGSGDWLAVGAPGERGGAGAVHVYQRTGGTWRHVHTVEASNAGAGDRFGDAVAWSADGSTLVVGAPLEDSTPRGIVSTPDEGSADSGALYVFRRSDWSETFLKGYGEPVPGSLLGTSVAVSADGRIVYGGAPGYDTGSVPVGAVYQFR